MKQPVLPAFLSVQGKRLTDDEKKLFAKYNPLGVCLFAYRCENVESRSQLLSLTNEIKNVIGRDDVLIAIDQEGGRVRRLCSDEFAPLTAQSELKTAEQAKNHAYLCSADLKAVGINVNFAPVLDVEYPTTSDALRGRCLSDNENNVACLGRVMVDEYIKCGICPCVKHLPGHGRGEADPHLELPVVNSGLNELQKDFYPFKQLADSPMGMVAHLVISAVDSQKPATESKKVINDIIRKEIGFSGLLVSDAIMMNALKGSIAERAVNVFESGCEIVCLGNADFKANYDLCHTGLKMSDAAIERMEKVKKIISVAENFSKYEYVKNKYCENQKNIVAYSHEYDATEVLNRIDKEKSV